MKKNTKREIEIMKTFEDHPSLEGRYFYEGYLLEQELIEEKRFVDEKSMDYYEGWKIEKCSACAAKLLFLHIEPCKLNNGLPDYDCERGVSYLIEVWKEKGIFDYCDHESKSMRLLNFLFNYLDMSTILREYISKK